MNQDELAKLDAAWGATKPAEPMRDGFDPIPEGTVVEGVVFDYKAARVGEKQTPVCKLSIEVVNPKEYEGRWVFGDLWITEANAKNLMRDLEFLGWKGGKPSRLMADGDTSLMGCGAKFSVMTETYQRKNKQSGMPMVDENGKPVMSSTNKVKFFVGPFVYTGKTKVAMRAEVKAATEAASVSAPAPGADVPDDIPF
jgi:hypothetical protein